MEIRTIEIKGNTLYGIVDQSNFFYKDQWFCDEHSAKLGMLNFATETVKSIEEYYQNRTNSKGLPTQGRWNKDHKLRHTIAKNVMEALEKEFNSQSTIKDFLSEYGLTMEQLQSMKG